MFGASTGRLCASGIEAATAKRAMPMPDAHRRHGMLQVHLKDVGAILRVFIAWFVVHRFDNRCSEVLPASVIY